MLLFDAVFQLFQVTGRIGSITTQRQQFFRNGIVSRYQYGLLKPFSFIHFNRSLPVLLSSITNIVSFVMSSVLFKLFCCLVDNGLRLSDYIIDSLADFYYCIRNSPYKNGNGDIVGELSKACKKYGLKFGVYLSPWDRNQTSYGSKYYVEYYKRQLKELLSNYGDIFEVWFDGANGGDGWYGGAAEKRTIDRKNYYEFDKLYQIVDSLQPKVSVTTPHSCSTSLLTRTV